MGRKENNQPERTEKEHGSAENLRNQTKMRLSKNNTTCCRGISSLGSRPLLVILMTLSSGSSLVVAQVENRSRTSPPVTAEIRGRNFDVTLAPGEGTILCLGTDEDFAAVKQRYFSPGPSAPETTNTQSTIRPYHLDFMPMGFYLGDKAFYEKAAAEMGIDVWVYLGRLLDHLKAAGANTIYLQGGSLTAPEMPEFVHRRGFKVILQMDDLYFRGSDYFKGAKGPWSQYAGPSEYFEGSLKPQLEKLLPSLEKNTSIWSCSPVEELPADSERFFTPYKEMIRRLSPRLVHFQLDSQQSNAEQLAAKQPPYPDLFGFDRYPWWSQPGDNAAKHGLSFYLWTPHFSARWLYNAMKAYTDGVHRLYQRRTRSPLFRDRPPSTTIAARRGINTDGWRMLTSSPPPHHRSAGTGSVIYGAGGAPTFPLQVQRACKAGLASARA